MLCVAWVACKLNMMLCFPVHVQALTLCAPAVLDVSSGVCGSDGLTKDALKIRNFVAAAKRF